MASLFIWRFPTVEIYVEYTGCQQKKRHLYLDLKLHTHNIFIKYS